MIHGLNHITLAVTDIERSFSFYQDLLGFKPLVKWARGAYFLIGKNDLWFCLNVDEKRKPHHCYTHYAFTVSKKEFDSMKKKLLDDGVISFQENSSPGDSFYFLDPDRHKLEIHVGSAQDRLAAKKNDPGAWKDVEWFV
ncbi:MAG: glutathione transferase [Verrucomicrobia bacterium]|nr:glutathione transferase [Verrucomicrobiota bacterium]